MTDEAEADADDISALRGLRVLVAEDRGLIARKLTQILSGAGCVVVGPVSMLPAGLALAEREQGTMDAAVLDIDLQGKEVYPLAEVLRARGVPLLFLTGYGPLIIPPPWRDAPRIEKPFEASGLLLALAAVVAGKACQPSGATGHGDGPLPLVRTAWEIIRRGRDLSVESQILIQSTPRRWNEPGG